MLYVILIQFERMINSWVVFSSIAFLATLSVNLLIRKIHLNNVSLRIQNCVQFVIPFLGFLIWGFLQPDLLRINLIHLLLVIIFAVVFTQIGTVLANKSITLATNPGYATAVTRINALITTLASVLFFGSYLSHLTFAAILIITMASFLFVDYRKKELKKDSNLWIWYAIGSGVLTSGYALSSKFFINENIPLLTRMFYAFFAMSIVQTADLFISKTKIDVKKINIFFLFMLGISTFLFNIFAQLAFESAPNPGFVNAFLAASIVPTTFFAAFIFKDELSRNKIFGVLGILAGLILLYIYS